MGQRSSHGQDQKRLPTEAEWEYAARGGNKSKGYLYSGSNTAGEVATWRILTPGNSNVTYDVGMMLPNELDLHDMSGNVSEWCWDWYGDYDIGTGVKTDPTGPTTSASQLGDDEYRVIRGGSWTFDVYRVQSLRVTDRSEGRVFSKSTSPIKKNDDTGFRLVLSAF